MEEHSSCGELLQPLQVGPDRSSFQISEQGSRDASHPPDLAILFASIANSYGLFRRMTGVGGRPEVSVEVSNNGEQWYEINFKYKPDNVDEMPLFVLPHQPRLDWQMWCVGIRA